MRRPAIPLHSRGALRWRWFLSILRAFIPPVHNTRFWAVQALVVLVAAGHYAAEFERYSISGFHIPTIIPISFFFIPVLYAALNFGLPGSLATAIWCTLISIPNMAVLHPSINQVAGAYQEVIQLAILDGLALFVGMRVDRERKARERAESATQALAISEERYRGLFDSSPTPVLVLDPQGTVLEANRASGALFHTEPQALTGKSLAQLLGEETYRRLLSPEGEASGPSYVVVRHNRNNLYLEPGLTRLRGVDGQEVLQLVLRDVTLEHRRRAGLQAYALSVLRAQEEERKRIAQELHDDTVQALVLLCRELDMAEAGPTELPTPVAQRLERARRSAEEVVARLRDFARALRPPTLDDLGVTASLRRLLAEVSERVGLEATLRVEGKERRLSPEVELAVFRIGQEAIHNAERHAQCTRLVVTLSFGDRGITLEVEDNGRGFTPPPHLDAFLEDGHLGLRGMQERARLLGGRVEFHSTPGRGTRVVASIPYTPPVPATGLAGGEDAT